MRIKILFPVLLILFGSVSGCGLSSPTGFPSATPVEVSSPTTALATLSPSVWLTQLNVFFQAGDLPDNIQPGPLNNAIPGQEIAYKLGAVPDGAANLSFQNPGAGQQDYGNVTVYYYKDPGMLTKASQALIQSEQARRQGTPQAGIGDLAMLFLPEQPGRDTALFFQICHSFIQIRLLSIDDSAIIQRYAGRVSERLQWLDCKGNATIPILTPAPAILTPTATLPIPITQGSTQVQRLPDPEGATTIRAYAFADPQHGWLALGADVLMTANSGKSWQLQTTTDSRVEKVRFETAQTGWILTKNGYLVTQDGGSDWQRSDSQLTETVAAMPAPPTTLLDQLESYAFCPGEAPFAGVFTSIDPQIGWAFCTSRPDTHFNNVQLFQTRDGGQHWQLLLDQAPYGRYGASNLFFLDDQHGWLAVSNEGESGLFATSDGGRSWHPVVLDQNTLGAPENARSVTFLTSEVGFVILSNSADNQGRDVLLGTRDGGVTWQEVFDAPSPAPWPDGPFKIFADGHGIGFEEVPGAAGLEDTPLVTTDWGKSWTPFGILIQASGCGNVYEEITSLSFADVEHGWATLSCGSSPSTTILNTTDGGKTWRADPLPAISSTGFVDVSFPNVSTGYLISQSGLLFRTINSGISFSPVDRQAVHTRSLQFITSDLGWEVRANNLFETTDGGSSWHPLPFPLAVQYFALLPKQNAWVVAGDTTSDNGLPPRRIFTTFDDGKTWEEFPFGEVSSNLNFPWLDGIQFADDLHGWLRGGSSLFYTGVGGKTWTQVH